MARQKHQGGVLGGNKKFFFKKDNYCQGREVSEVASQEVARGNIFCKRGLKFATCREIKHFFET